jgi:hypothetical protein
MPPADAPDMVQFKKEIARQIGMGSSSFSAAAVLAAPDVVVDKLCLKRTYDEEGEGWAFFLLSQQGETLRKIKTYAPHVDTSEGDIKFGWDTKEEQCFSYHRSIFVLHPQKFLTVSESVRK